VDLAWADLSGDSALGVDGRDRFQDDDRWEERWDNGESRSSRERDPLDVEGWWEITHVVEDSSVDDFEGLRLGYRILLRQNGSRITGEGEKWLEDGTRLEGRARTSITLSGEIDDRWVRLDFTERGTRRTTSGWLDLTLVDGGNALAGTFRSTAADSWGRSSGRRVH
jgi:hypothetical protein